MPTQETTKEKLPVVNKQIQNRVESDSLKQTVLREVSNSRLNAEEKQQIKDVLDSMEQVTETDIESIRKTIEMANKSNMLPTDINYQYNAERKKTYMKYKTDNNSYDATAVNQVLDMIPTNRNGRRTVKQWLQVASEVGTRIANKTDADIERIAYKSWFDLQPTKSITRYDSQTKSNIGFQKLTSNEWLNTINNAVNEARENGVDFENNENNTQNIPTPAKTMQENNLIQQSENMTDEEVAKILTETKGKPKDARSMKAFLKANLIDKGMVFEELSRKTNNRELQGKWDYTLTAEARGQNAIGNERLDSNGKVISKSLTDIIDEVGKNAPDFYQYMYHQLNIDRMTLADRFNGDTGLNYERRKEIKNKPVFRRKSNSRYFKKNGR